MKKFLALVLALVMTMSLVTISAGAEDFTDADDVTYAEAVDVMTAIGVVGGYADGSFNPDAGLTRGAAAKIICNMLLGPTTAEALVANEAPYSDVAVDNVFAGYIAYCANEGIISGYADGTFKPAAPLTGYAFMKMLLGALGYDAVNEGYVGSNWSIAVAKRALNIGLDAGLEGAFSGAKALTREEACLYALNTLKATMVEYDNDSKITIGDITISNSSKVEEIAVTSEGSANYAGSSGSGVNFKQFCEVYFKDLTLSESVDAYNCEANIWSWKSDEVGTYAVKSAILATYTTEVGTVTLGDLYKLAPTTDLVLEVYENGTANGTVTAAKGSTTKAFDTTYQGATIFVVDDDADGKADTLAVKYPYLAKVTKVTEATASVDRFVTMEVYNDASMVATTGVTYTTDEFAKDDYVLVYVDGDYATTEAMIASEISATDVILDVVAAETVVGKVSSVAGTNGSAVTALTVDGVKYTAADANFATLGLIAGSTAVADSTYGFTSEYTLYLANGYVIGVKGAAAAGSTITNIVYVTKAAYSNTNEYGESTYMVETVAFDGTTEIVENYGWYDTDLNGGERVKDGKVYTSATSNATAIAAGFYVKEYDSATKSYKFTLPVATTSTALDNATNYYGTNALNGAVAMTADTKAVTIDQVAGSGPVKAYVTANTALLFVDGTGSKLAVSVQNGAMKQNLADNSLVLLSKDTDGNYIAEVIVVATKKVDVSANTVYVDGTATGVNTEGNEYSMYNLTTGEKTTVTSDNAGSVNGYVTYSVNDKGVYTFAAVSTSSSNNADGVYALSASATKFGTTLSNGGFLVDCEAGAAVIINVTGSDANDNLTLDDVAKATSLTAVALVDDEVVTAIVVTAITKAV